MRSRSYEPSTEHVGDQRIAVGVLADGADAADASFGVQFLLAGISHSKTPLFGPEFQIYTPTESILRGNFLWEVISNPATDMTTDLSPFTAVAGNTQQLIDAVDQALLYGRMPGPMRQSLANAIVAQSDNNSRMQTALYLTALSGLYAVQY